MNADKLKTQLTEIAAEGTQHSPDLWPAIREQVMDTKAEAAGHVLPHGAPSVRAGRVWKAGLTPVLALLLILALIGVTMIMSRQNAPASNQIGGGMVQEITPTSTVPVPTPNDTISGLDEPIAQPLRPFMTYTVAMPDGERVELSSDFVPLIPTVLPEGFVYSGSEAGADQFTLTFEALDGFIRMTQRIGAARIEMPAYDKLGVEALGTEAAVGVSDEGTHLVVQISSGIQVEMMTSLPVDEALEVLGSLDFQNPRLAFNEALPDGSALVFSSGFVPLVPTVLPEGFTYSGGLITDIVIMVFESADGADRLQISQYRHIGFEPLQELDPANPLEIYGSGAAVHQVDDETLMLIWRTQDGTRIELSTTLPIEEAYQVARGLVYASPRAMPEGELPDEGLVIPNGMVEVMGQVKQLERVDGQIRIILQTPIEGENGAVFTTVLVEGSAPLWRQSGTQNPTLFNNLLPGMALWFAVQAEDLESQGGVLTAYQVFWP
jgi:hypothetical protein